MEAEYIDIQGRKKVGGGVRGVNFEGGQRFISNWLGLFGNQSDFYIWSTQKTTKAISQWTKTSDSF